VRVYHPHAIPRTKSESPVALRFKSPTSRCCP
jgi:hypothetical protein